MQSPHVISTDDPDSILSALSSQPGLFSTVGKLIDWMSGHGSLPQDPAALSAWARDTAAFNARWPAGMPTTPCGQGAELASNGVRYYAISGNTAKTNAWDPSDPI